MTNGQLPHQTPTNWEVDDLSELLDRIWSSFARGAYSNREAFHWPGFATIDAQGCPQVRTVVLRRSDKPSRALEFHTDVRAGKAQEIAANPLVSWYFFDPERQVQLRVKATAHIHERDAHARRVWDGLSPSSRHIYTVSPAPGTEVETPQSGLPSPRESGPFIIPGADQGWANFVVVATSVQEIDFLVLGRRGHRRARFTWNAEAEQWDAAWLIP